MKLSRLQRWLIRNRFGDPRTEAAKKARRDHYASLAFTAEQIKAARADADS